MLVKQLVVREKITRNLLIVCCSLISSITEFFELVIEVILVNQGLVIQGLSIYKKTKIIQIYYSIPFE